MRNRIINCVVFVLASIVVSPVFAGPPLPLHSIEGSGGILITGSAWLVNPSEDGDVFGLPSVSPTIANLGDGRHLEAYTLTETIGGRIELGYGFNRLDLGDLRSDIQSATTIDIKEDMVEMHNFNVRALLVKDGGFGQAWMPAITLGLHYKKNETIADIDDRLAGTLKGLGIDDDDGVDVTLYASKMFTSLPRPMFLNVGLRSTEAAHIGLLGFTDDRKILAEANFGVLVLNNLVIGGEYRQKPHEYTPLPGLIEDEDDWWSAFVTYVASEHLTASIAYAHLGDVLNHEANDTYGFKFKYEF